MLATLLVVAFLALAATGCGTDRPVRPPAEVLDVMSYVRWCGKSADIAIRGSGCELLIVVYGPMENDEMSSGSSAALANEQGEIIGWTRDSGDVMFSSWGRFTKNDVDRLMDRWSGDVQSASPEETAKAVGACRPTPANQPVQPTGSAGG